MMQYLEFCTPVLDMIVLFHGNVTPMRDLNDSDQICHWDEWRVVLKVNSHRVHTVGLSVCVWSIRDAALTDGHRLLFGVGFNAACWYVDWGWLGGSFVWREVMVIGREDNKLLLWLANLLGEWSQSMGEGGLNTDSDWVTRLHALSQLNMECKDISTRTKQKLTRNCQGINWMHYTCQTAVN